MARSLPNLGKLPLGGTPTGVGIGRRSAEDAEHEGRSRIDRKHDETVEKRMKESDMRDAREEDLRRHWQYYQGLYRDENVIPNVPDEYKELIDKPEYKGSRLELSKNTRIRVFRRAYHAKITFASPKIYETNANPESFWLRQHITRHYVDIDKKIHKLLLDIGHDAVRYIHGDKLNSVMQTALRRTITPGNDDDVYSFVESKVKVQSLHVGRMSHRGIMLYWRLKDELYDLDEDPGERKNLLRKKGDPPEAHAQLRAMLTWKTWGRL